jgi:hypothetical protein
MLLCLLLAVPGVTEAAALKTHSQFAAHKALYDIRLLATKSGSQIVNITGKMLYEWEPTCDAWISNHRFKLSYEYADTPPMNIVSDFSTYEPFDGKSIDYTSQRKRDGQLIEELRGSAEIDEKGKGAAVYTIPRGLEFDLPEGTMFPMTHTLNVIKAISEGKKIYNGTVFDGSDADGPIEINAVVGKALRANEIVKPSQNIDAKLVASPAHKVRLAFFPLSNASESADYEMDIAIHDNGVISDMHIEYDDFSITQKLVALEPLPGGCPANKSAE